MSANPTAAPTGRKKIAQGKERSDAALGHDSKNISSPERAKEGGELPKGWRRVAIKDMADSIQYGLTASAAERKNGPRFLRITDIQDGRVDWSTVPSCDIPKEQISKYRLSSGDLVFARTGATTGKSFLIGECPEAVFASYLIRVRVSADVDSRYLSAFFQSPDYWRQIESGKRGIGQPNVNGTVLGEVQFPIAPISEQKKIVGEIEKQFTRLEAGVAALRRVQANLKRYRAAVLKAACEGRLVPTEAELHRKLKTKNSKLETGEQLLARILTERRQNWQGRGKYKEPDISDTLNLDPLPDGWTWASLDQVCVKITDGTHHSPQNSAEGDCLYITSKNVREFRLDLENVTYIDKATHDEIYARCDVKLNDVLYVKDGANTGLAAKNTIKEPFSLLSSVGVFRPISSVNPDYLVAYLNSKATRDRMLSQIAGVAITRLTLSKLKISAIAVPPLAEQTRIVAEVERRLSVVEELESVVTANLQRATRLRQSILQRAFSGGF